MEKIQKKIERIMTTGTTTGCTPCAVIIPDTTVNYYFKISLTAESPDIGFFDAFMPQITAYYPYGTALNEYNTLVLGIGESLLFNIGYI